MGRRKLVRIILESAPDTKILNQQKESSIDIACRKNHLDIAEIIRNPPPEILKANGGGGQGIGGKKGPSNGGVEVVDAAEFDLMEKSMMTEKGTGKSGKGKHKKDKRSTVVQKINLNFLVLISCP